MWKCNAPPSSFATSSSCEWRSTPGKDIACENLDQELMRPFDSAFSSTERICKYNPKNSSHLAFINNWSRISEMSELLICLAEDVISKALGIFLVEMAQSVEHYKGIASQENLFNDNNNL